MKEAPQMTAEEALPPLPEPACVHGGGVNLSHRFTAAQMHAYLLADRRARALELHSKLSQEIEAGQPDPLHVMVPAVPTEAMLRPFYGCPPDELGLAWQAMLHIARVLAVQPISDAAKGALKVAVDLLREVVGPLEVSAAVIEDEDGGEAIETLLASVKRYVEQFDRAGLATPAGEADGAEVQDDGPEPLTEEESREYAADHALALRSIKSTAEDAVVSGDAPMWLWALQGIAQVSFAALHTEAAASAVPLTVGAVPTGWKLVPIEPTPEMLDAPPNAWPADAKVTYDALLAASPPAQVAQADQSDDSRPEIDPYNQGWKDGYRHGAWAAVPPNLVNSEPTEAMVDAACDAVGLCAADKADDEIRQEYRVAWRAMFSASALAVPQVEVQICDGVLRAPQADQSALSEKLEMDRESVCSAEHAISRSPATTLALIRRLQAERDEARAALRTQEAARDQSGVPSQAKHVCGMQGFGHSLDDECPACKALRAGQAGVPSQEHGDTGIRTIHGIQMDRDSDGSFAVTMPDRWFSCSPGNDAEDNLEGELCMLLGHLWKAARIAPQEAAPAKAMEVLAELVEWETKYPASKVFSYSAIGRITSELTAIVVRARALVSQKGQ